MKKAALILFTVLVLCGCEQEKTEKQLEEGHVRYTIFVECMKLAAEMKRQGDDDVSDAIDACSTQSHYIANGMF